MKLNSGDMFLDRDNDIFIVLKGEYLHDTGEEEYDGIWGVYFDSSHKNYTRILPYSGGEGEMIRHLSLPNTKYLGNFINIIPSLKRLADEI